MSFVEDHLEYIRKAASVQAWQIVRATGRRSEKEDFEQELIMQIIRVAPRYDPRRSKPKTFISLVAQTAANKILIRLHSKKETSLHEAKRI